MKKEILFESIADTKTLPQYPVECFCMKNNKKVVCANFHWHLYSEIIYIIKGRLDVYINSSKYEMYDGDLIYINPKQIHSTNFSTNENTKLIVVKFSQAILKSSFENYTEVKYIFPFFWQSKNQFFFFNSKELFITEVPSILENIFLEINHKNFGYEYAIHNDICRLILIFLRILYKKEGEKLFKEVSDEELHKFYKVFEYINEHYNEEIDISTILKLCNLSYSNFAMKFKKLSGKTYTQYLNYVRVSYGERLILSTNLTISDIATKCGYNDVCYFIRIFKRLKDKSPYKYRKEYNNINLR